MKKNRNAIITVRCTHELKSELIKSAFLNFDGEKEFRTLNDYINYVLTKEVEKRWQTKLLD